MSGLELISLLTILCTGKDDYVNEAVAQEFKPLLVATTESYGQTLPVLVTYSARKNEIIVAIVQKNDCVFKVAEGKGVQFILDDELKGEKGASLDR